MRKVGLRIVVFKIGVCFLRQNEIGSVTAWLCRVAGRRTGRLCTESFLSSTPVSGVNY